MARSVVLWLSEASFFLAADDCLKTFHVSIFSILVNRLASISVDLVTSVLGIPVVLVIRVASVSVVLVTPVVSLVPVVPISSIVIVVPPTEVTSSIVVTRLLFLDVDIKVAYFASFRLLRDC